MIQGKKSVRYYFLKYVQQMILDIRLAAQLVKQNDSNKCVSQAHSCGDAQVSYYVACKSQSITLIRMIT